MKSDLFDAQIERQPPQDLNNPKTSAVKKPLSGKLVLIVDDAPDNRMLISRYLEIAGASVQVANDGLAAIEKAFQENFNVILMDLQMPQMDGYEAIQVLRKKGYQKPVIALTAHAMKGDRELCLKAGFNDHLSKPIDRVALIESILKLH